MAFGKSSISMGNGKAVAMEKKTWKNPDCS
jgi:hypothetical protein